VALGVANVVPHGASAQTLAPLCSEVESTLIPSADGFPPLPTNQSPPIGVSPGDLEKLMQGVPFSGGGYYPWISRGFAVVEPEHVDAARRALGTDPANEYCVEVHADQLPVAVQPTSGSGWRLVFAGPFDGPLISVSSTSDSHRQLWEKVGVPIQQRRRVKDTEVLVAYTLHRPGNCVADRVTGFALNLRLNTFQLERAPGPVTDSCPLKRKPWSVVIAVDRSAFPNRQMAFRSCKKGIDCSWTYLLFDATGSVPFGFVSVPRPSRTVGSCTEGSLTLQLPPVVLCQLIARFNATRFVATTRYSSGQVVDYLLSPTGTPIELPGRVIAAKLNFVAMLHGGLLKVRRGNSTRSVLRFSDGLPDVTSSGRTGAFNNSGTRLALPLLAADAEPGSDIVGVGLIEVSTGNIVTVLIAQWQFPIWKSDSIVAIGSVTLDATTGSVLA
jgi:hypothetical protein